jgi:tRNA pseudouridine55 synthase
MTAGIINVLKPPGMTSHDVVAFIRRLYGEKRVGHAGTLDPAAAGVLPIFIGRATRLLEYSADGEKSYRAEISWGYETDTGDDTGKIIFSAPCVVPDFDQLNEILHSFVGTSEQIPPMYSAVKIGGKKLYELARQGIAIDRPARTIEIRSIALKKLTDKKAIFDVTCSKGTYIRALCTDIGRKAGCPAVMSFLVRTRVGLFLCLMLIH